MLIPFLAMAFMAMDTAWALFVKATLEHAVHEGVRYGVTGQVSGNLSSAASIEAVVQQQSMGLLSGSQSGALSVQFLDPATLATTSSNQSGNLVQVSITNYQIAPLAPLLRSATAIPVNVSALDIIEGGQ
jgi:Flp pilus assembly protein TadG